MKLYYTQKELCEHLGCSRDFVRRRVEGMRKQIDRGRYMPIAISGNFIHIVSFMDYNTYHEQLEDPILRRGVPKFDVARATQYFYQPDVKEDYTVDVREIVKQTIMEIFSRVAR